MAKITKDDILHLATLSRVSLESAEVDKLQIELEAILGYVEQLSHLDTKGVAPTYQVNGLENIWREDIVNEDSLSRETLFELTAEKQDQQIKVPKVL
jgi:aspartyl-tRNA(Asn)/glutamyl-tRNA(Gln) amidotransferase subunit C